MTMKFLITLFILAVCTRTVQSTNRKTQRNFIRSMKSVVGRICSDITTMKDKIMDLETVLQEKVRDIEVENDGLKVKVSDLEMKVSDLEQIVNQTDPAVAFSAYVDENTSPSKAGDVYVFDKVLTNKGQAYDESTGVFTCPISGTYVFTFVASARNDSTTYAKLIVNSTEILHVIAETTGEFDDDQGANIAVVQCNKGDDVWVAGDGTLRGDTEGNSDTRTSSFSGFLLHQTSD